MAQLKFVVKDQIIARIDKFHPVAKSRGFLKAEFEFSQEEWNGVVTAIFSADYISEPIRQIIGEDGTCDVPDAVTDQAGVFFVSVYTSNSGIERITTNKAAVHIHETGYSENTIDPPETPEDVYDQLVSIASETKKIAQSVRDDADAGKFDGQPGKPGIPGKNGTNATITNATASVTSEGETPSCEVVLGGTPSERTFEFNFKGISGGGSGTGSALPAVTPEDYGKQLFARGETWVIDEPVCGIVGMAAIFEQEISTPMIIEENVPVLTAGETYAVGFDGNKTYAIAKSFEETVAYIGNLSLTDPSLENTGENF